MHIRNALDADYIIDVSVTVNCHYDFVRRISENGLHFFSIIDSRETGKWLMTKDDDWTVQSRQLLFQPLGLLFADI